MHKAYSLRILPQDGQERATVKPIQDGSSSDNQH